MQFTSQLIYQMYRKVINNIKDLHNDCIIFPNHDEIVQNWNNQSSFYQLIVKAVVHPSFQGKHMQKSRQLNLLELPKHFQLTKKQKKSISRS